MQWLFRQGFFFISETRKWLLVALDRWLSYTVMIVRKLSWADSALVILGEWLSYREGCLSRFDCNDLSEEITSIVKVFTDDTSPFSFVNDPNISANEQNKDFINFRIGIQMEMSFNPDNNKQAKSPKPSRPKHPQLIDTCCLFFLSKAPWNYFR